MKRNPESLFGCLAATCLLLAGSLQAQTITPTTIYTFDSSSTLAATPTGELVSDGAGNFYGTTQYGGDNGLGSIYKVTPAGDFTTIHSFAGDANGYYPQSALVRGSDGNFYGTTSYAVSGAGAVFKMSPDGTTTLLHRFSASSAEGRTPLGGLVFGADGKLYGTTTNGGDNNVGTIYAITAGGTLTTLHSFAKGEGTNPQCGLTLGRDGNLYGVAAFNDNNGASTNSRGSVFKITPDGSFNVVYLLNGTTDGAYPADTLLQGSDGNFYGVCPGGGANGTGTIFKVTPDGAYTVLYSFSVLGSDSTNADGVRPNNALVDGGDGKFYGLASAGGANGTGTAFSITPGGTLATLYSFPALDSNKANSSGAYPVAGFSKVTNGSLYVPLTAGGANSKGDILAFAIGGPPSSFFTGQVALSNGVYYLSFPNGNIFGYYAYFSDPHYLYHFDLGYEYVIDANDGNKGVYFYDFASNTFLYTSQVFAFPYLYDFSLKAILYYYPDTTSAGRYTRNPRYFYNFSTNQIITK